MLFLLDQYSLFISRLLWRNYLPFHILICISPPLSLTEKGRKCRSVCVPNETRRYTHKRIDSTSLHPGMEFLSLTLWGEVTHHSILQTTTYRKEREKERGREKRAILTCVFSSLICSVSIYNYLYNVWK